MKNQIITVNKLDLTWKQSFLINGTVILPPLVFPGYTILPSDHFRVGDYLTTGKLRSFR
jgi:hypothetical protein